MLVQKAEEDIKKHVELQTLKAELMQVQAELAEAEKLIPKNNKKK